MEMIYLMAPIYPIDLYRWDLTESPLTLNVAMIAFALLTPRTLVAIPLNEKPKKLELNNLI